MSTLESLHHAYYLEGDRELLSRSLKKYLRAELKIETKGNPDVIHVDVDTFGINTARDIHEKSHVHPLGGQGKFFILSFDTLTREAQNALLKVFEEPTDDTYFFLITPSVRKLLPTLRSRLLSFPITDLTQEESTEEEFDATTFFQVKTAKRLTFFEDIIKERDAQRALFMLSQMEKYLHNNQLDFEKNSYQEFLSEVLQAKKYLSSRGSSVKLLLEHIALIAPNMKTR